MDLNINLNIAISPSNQAPAWATDVSTVLGLIVEKLGVVLEKETMIMSSQTDALDKAEAAAAANAAADASAEALLLELVKMYQDAVASSTDPAVVARITALGEAITAHSTKLSAAVVANTPVAPQP